ncbi:MAG: ABC transporter permease [Treponema sp.]|nr:ABC transporter permease [Treponema sp.]
MNIIELLSTCFRNIFRNRMKSFLTSLGIIIGVGAVIIMVAIGEGAQKQIEERITAMGTNLLQIMPRRIRMMPGQQTMPRRIQITRYDAEKVKSEAGYARAVSGISQRNFTVSNANGSASVAVMGVEPDYLTIRNWNVEQGAFFDDSDGERRNKVAVLGRTTIATFFGNDDPIGKQIRIGSNQFSVIGVLEKKGAAGNGNDQDDVIMIPLDTMSTRLTNTKNINQIAISVAHKDYMEAAQKEAELILREAHKLSDLDAADFEIMNQSDMLDMASETSKSLTTLLAAIAGVSLLVGGIGIMNIMLVSVSERTREIGIRMAIGARKKDILFQFLSEAVILSLLGGFIGIGLAFIACNMLALMEIPTSINMLVVITAALFAAFVGITFGYYPAQKAANRNPIDALRYE